MRFLSLRALGCRCSPRANEQQKSLLRCRSPEGSFAFCDVLAALGCSASLNQVGGRRAKYEIHRGFIHDVLNFSSAALLVKRVREIFAGVHDATPRAA